MPDDKWIESEKKIARQIFDLALQREIDEIMNNFKKKANNSKTADDMWDILEYLKNAKRDIESKYDYRYSQLKLVFGILLREGKLKEDEMKGLDPRKIDDIKRIANI